MSADEIKRAEYEARELAIIDFNSQTHYAEERGEKRGLERGLEQGIQNLILACRTLGATKDHIIQQVIDLYRLSLDEATDKVNTIYRLEASVQES
jgi:hypothetical protein